MVALNRKAVIRPVKATAPVPMGYSGNGNLQYVKTDKTSLIEIATSVFYGKDQFYNTAEGLYQRAKANIRSLVSQNEFDFIANVALYARTQMDMRSYPIAIVVEFASALADQKKSYANMRALVRDVITRADELTELYGYALSVFGNKKCIPLAIKKGVADAFNKFDEYQLAKYNGGSRNIKLRDLLRIVHPVPKDEAQSALFAKLMTDSMTTPYTWETELSANGQKHKAEQKSKALIWEELIDSGKLGYMALLKNLRNIETEGNTSLINKAATIISDRNKVLRSRQLPMNFMTAYDNVASAALRGAIDKAIEYSAGNIPNLGARVALIIDNSGSMGGKPAELASLFASMIVGAHQDSQVTTVVFANQAVEIKGSANRHSMSSAIRNSRIGGGTNLQSALTLLHGKQFDAIFVLSDGDVDKTQLRQCNKLGGKDAIKVIFNFSASETTPFREDNSFFITGLSPKVFTYLKYAGQVDGISGILSTGYNQFQRVA
jgi:hypothetical protein